MVQNKGSMGHVKPTPLHRESIFRSAIQTFGAQMQFLKLREEIAELQVAMARYELLRDSIDSVVEELADVIIMTSQARIMLGTERVDAVIEQKLARLVKTIETVRRGSK